MAGRGPQTFKKRQKEQQRKEKQQDLVQTLDRMAQEAADYCGRYGELLLKLSSRPVTPDVWALENIGRAAATAGEQLSSGEIANKSRWRNERLAALLAHKRAQKSFTN